MTGPSCANGAFHETGDFCEPCDLAEDLKRARGLLRDWRDKYGGKEHLTFKSPQHGVIGASATDLLRDTNKFLEGK